MKKEKTNKATVVVPASSANLGPGFDVFSVALKEPTLTIYAELRDDENIRIVNQGSYASEVSTNPEQHSGAQAIKNLLEDKGIRKGFDFVVWVDIPPRKGLGISGAEAVGFIYAANHILSLNLSEIEIIKYAASAEPGMHLDNVAASALGGFVITLRDSLLNKLTARKIHPPEDLGFAVIIPDIKKTSTATARTALPVNVDVKKHIEAAARCSLIAYSLAKDDIDLLLEVVSYDPYAEPVRADTGIYGEGINRETLMQEKKILLERFHVAETISGAGPSRLLWFRKSENQKTGSERPIDEAVKLVVRNLEKHGHKAVSIIETEPSNVGCQLL